jgi:hypothetical protein
MNTSEARPAASEAGLMAFVLTTHGPHSKGFIATTGTSRRVPSRIVGTIPSLGVWQSVARDGLIGRTTAHRPQFSNGRSYCLTVYLIILNVLRPPGHCGTEIAGK